MERMDRLSDRATSMGVWGHEGRVPRAVRLNV